MEIDLSVLKTLEREREVPFDELVRITEHAIMQAYLRSQEHRGSDAPKVRVTITRAHSSSSTASSTASAVSRR